MLLGILIGFIIWFLVRGILLESFDLRTQFFLLRLFKVDFLRFLEIILDSFGKSFFNVIYLLNMIIYN